MPAIGQDCEVILDGSGYFIKPGTFKMKQPRIRKATILFTDPLNSASLSVHFDSYAEIIYDLHIQQVALATGHSAALSYEVEIELVET